MKVYELIQELVKFEPDADVGVNIVLDKKELEAKIGNVPDDLEVGDEVEVQVELDEDADDFEIDTGIKYQAGMRKEYCRIIATLG